jgi:hypothetical protein
MGKRVDIFIKAAMMATTMARTAANAACSRVIMAPSINRGAYVLRKSI